MSRIQLASLLLVFLLASPTEASRLGNGSKAIGGYGKDFAVVVPSQLSIRSNAALGLLFLLPLLAALVLPTVWRSLARPRPLAPALAHDMDRPLPAAAPSMEPKPSLPLAAATDQASCIRCGRPLRPDARFCSGCGAPVAAAPAPPSSIACPQCGRLARPGTKFCGGCGRKLT